MSSMINNDEQNHPSSSLQQDPSKRTEEIKLLLKFTFGVPECEIVEKTPEEVLLDSLWAEFEDALEMNLLLKLHFYNRPPPKSAIQRIADKLRSLGYTEPEPLTETERSQHGDVASAGEIFVPLPNRLPKYRVGHTIDPSWSTPENPVPRPGSGRAISRYHELRNVVEEEKRVAARSKEKDREKVPTLAELSLKENELRRLRSVGLKVRKKLKVGKAGITEGVVNGIHERWRREEVVKLACEDLCKMNMKMTHEILERKTGGLVVWRSGGTIILYRGDNYKYPYFLAGNYTTNDTTHEVSVDSRMNYVRDGNRESYSSNMDKVKSGGTTKSNNIVQPSIVKGVGSPNRVRFQLPGEAQIADEADRLLDGLGPRFTDWWGYEPLPIDADLLPAVVPGYRKPFRLLPYGLAPKLTNDEMIILRGLGKPLPCHFALGRNRDLQGLAAAIVKLWEKCEIAKVAIKRGVQNTNSELMAEELKRLTGGTLLSRDREFIVLYRGKDFLPLAVSSAIEERRKLGLRGEKQRIAFSSSMVEKEGSELMTDQHAPENKPHKAETHKQNIILSEENALNSTEKSIRRTTTKLSSVLEKKARAEQLLAELEKAEIPQEPEIDKEGITAEERYMLRKVGLRMKPFLLLGRRGVFDGTVENMHLHWKYRELVKIISHQRRIDDLHGIARTLEAESGGILVAVERVNKGHAIIVYRGKNYNRPENLRPKTLLNKREAMKRSVEAQRRESLKLHILKLNKSIDNLKLDLVKGKEIHDTQAVDNSTQPPGEDRLEGSSTSTNSDHGMDALMNNPQAIRLDDEQITLSSTNDDTDTDAESESSSGTVMNQIETSIDLRSESVSVDSSSRPDISPILDPPRSSSATREMIPRVYSDEMTESTSTSQAAQNKWERSNGLNMNSRNRSDPVDTTSGPDRPLLPGQTSTSSSIIRMGSRVSFKRSKESSDHVYKTKLEQSSHKVVENRSNGVPVRVTALTNKERLLLRKQALMTKQRPVLAIGKSNIVTGVAKAIKTHFIKHPLAIVNIKGRAKGTSVQEVVFKLEQATGAVLVSQEPSKVILYRGWGADEKRDKANKKTETEGQFMKLTISPELLAAIKLECGLQSDQVEDSTS